MTFQDQMLLDAQFAIHAEAEEAIAYTSGELSPVSISAIIEAEGMVSEEELADGEGTTEEFKIWITDNTDSDNSPGIATPVRGDAVTLRGKSGFVVDIMDKALNGLWPLIVRVVDVTRRTPTPNTVARK